MSESEQEHPSPWQPLTPKGVAAFAFASLSRLLLVQLCFGLAAAAVTVFVSLQAWCPVVQDAIQALPAQGQIRYRTLQWMGESPTLLAGNRRLAFVVDWAHSGGIRPPADLVVEFGYRDFRLISLFGVTTLAYPEKYYFAFNRQDLIPWWGAWKPSVLALIGGGVIILLVASWTGLALVFMVPAWALARRMRRSLGLRQAWKLCGAALLPGSLFVSIAGFLYGTGMLELLQLVLAWGIHFAIAVLYIGAGVVCLPSAAGRKVANPFAAPTPVSPESVPQKDPAPKGDHG
jgi:hypothetical protein